MSKPRSDAALKLLPEARQEQIIEWCLTPKSEKCSGGYTYAMEQLAADGINVSRRAVSEFYHWWDLRRVFRQADKKSTDVQEWLTNAKAGLTQEQIDLAGNIVFTQEALANRDSEEFREMEYLRLAKQKARQKDEELAIANRRVALLERKISEAKETVGNSKLSDAEKAQRIREIFKRE